MRRAEHDIYYSWLLDRVGFRRSGYNDLMRTLYEMDFKYIVLRDRNREDDGLYLRDMFVQETGIEDSTGFSKPCSVLEMLIALAIRIDNEYIGDMAEAHPERIFWEMVRNLGLDLQTDNRFNEDTVEKILRRFMSRKFSPNGKGGLFPLKHPVKNQRTIEIWEQMQEYLTENY